MKKITGKDLRKLGFEKETDKSDSANPYHYYTYDVANKCLLISCSNDEKIDGSYDVEFFDIPEMKFRNLKNLKKLVKLLRRVDNE